MLEAQEEGRQRGRKETREDLLCNRDSYHPTPIASSVTRAAATHILPRSVDSQGPLPASVSERSISDATREKDDKTLVPEPSTTLYDTPAEETRQKPATSELGDSQVVERLQDLERIRADEYTKHTVQQPSAPGSSERRPGPAAGRLTWQPNEQYRQWIEVHKWLFTQPGSWFGGKALIQHARTLLLFLETVSDSHTIFKSKDAFTLSKNLTCPPGVVQTFKTVLSHESERAKHDNRVSRVFLAQAHMMQALIR